MRNGNEVLETIVQCQFVLNHLHLLNGKMICDVGIGKYPSLWYMLNNAGFTCMGIDNSDRIVFVHPTPLIEKRDVVTLDTFLSGRCNAVLCLDVLHGIKHYDQAIFNMIKMAAPGGLIILAAPYNHYKYCYNVVDDGYTQIFNSGQVDKWRKMIGDVVSIQYWKVWDGGRWRRGERLSYPEECDTYNADMFIMAARVPYSPAGLEEDMERCNYKLDDSWFRYYNGGPRRDGLRQRYNHIISSTVKGPVLDIGCGPGVTCTELRSKGFTVTGIDYSDKIIRIASARGGDYIWGKAEELPFDDDSFETVIMTEVLEHVVDIDKAIAEADRVARKNADILLSVPDGGGTSKFHLRSFDKEGFLAVLPWPVEESKIIDERIWVKCKKS